MGKKKRGSAPKQSSEDETTGSVPAIVISFAKYAEQMHPDYFNGTPRIFGETAEDMEIKDILMLYEQPIFDSIIYFLGKHGYDNLDVDPKFYIYAHGDVPIALSAHVDTVFHDPPPEIYITDAGYIFTYNEKRVGLGADDRAGIYIILKVIEAGYKPDLIITREEEHGEQGAAKAIEALEIPSHLKYIIALDRKGTNDAVFYHDDNKDFKKYIIDTFGFVRAQGTSADISRLCPAWKISGVNLSVGYDYQHSPDEVLNVSILKAMVTRVSEMLANPPVDQFQYIEEQMRYIRYENYESRWRAGEKQSRLTEYGTKRFSSLASWDRDGLIKNGVMLIKILQKIEGVTSVEIIEKFDGTGRSKVHFTRDNKEYFASIDFLAKESSWFDEQLRKMQEVKYDAVKYWMKYVDLTLENYSGFARKLSDALTGKKTTKKKPYDSYDVEGAARVSMLLKKLSFVKLINFIQYREGLQSTIKYETPKHLGIISSFSTAADDPGFIKSLSKEMPSFDEAGIKSALAWMKKIDDLLKYTNFVNDMYIKMDRLERAGKSKAKTEPESKIDKDKKIHKIAIDSALALLELSQFKCIDEIFIAEQKNGTGFGLVTYTRKDGHKMLISLAGAARNKNVIDAMSVERNNVTPLLDKMHFIDDMGGTAGFIEALKKEMERLTDKNLIAGTDSGYDGWFVKKRPSDKETTTGYNDEFSKQFDKITRDGYIKGSVDAIYFLAKLNMARDIILELTKKNGTGFGRIGYDSSTGSHYVSFEEASKDYSFAHRMRQENVSTTSINTILHWMESIDALGSYAGFIQDLEIALEKTLASSVIIDETKNTKWWWIKKDWHMYPKESKSKTASLKKPTNEKNASENLDYDPETRLTVTINVLNMIEKLSFVKNIVIGERQDGTGYAAIHLKDGGIIPLYAGKVVKDFSSKVKEELNDEKKSNELLEWMRVIYSWLNNDIEFASRVSNTRWQKAKEKKTVVVESTDAIQKFSDLFKKTQKSMLDKGFMVLHHLYTNSVNIRIIEKKNGTGTGFAAASSMKEKSEIITFAHCRKAKWLFDLLESKKYSDYSIETLLDTMERLDRDLSRFDGFAKALKDKWESDRPRALALNKK